MYTSIQQNLKTAEGKANSLLSAWSVIIFLGILIFAIETWMFRTHLLDDTFIHLRYADNLLKFGTLSYNIGQPSLGTSSPLYVVILAFIGEFIPKSGWPTLAKTISIIAHAVAILLVLNTVKSLHNTITYRGYKNNFLIFSLIVASILMFVTPSATRWFQDGMETSLAVTFSIGSALLLRKRLIKSEPSSFDIMTSALICALPGILRLDLIPISATTLIALIFLTKRQYAFTIVALTFLLLVGCYTILLVVAGYIVPDTAIAKQGIGLNPLWLLSFSRSMLSVSPLWLLAPLFLLASSLTQMWSRHTNLRYIIPVLFGILPLCFVIVAGSARDQIIHGARYFLPVLSYAWINFLLSLEMLFDQNIVANNKRQTNLLTALCVGGIVLSFAHVVYTWNMLNIVRRADYFEISPEFTNSSIILAAHDIGRIGWYTDAQIVDLAGLVNGRVVAEALPRERLCMGVEIVGTPDAFILTDSQKLPLDYDGYSVLLCDSSKRTLYQKVNIVMENENLSGSDAWWLWRRVKSD